MSNNASNTPPDNRLAPTDKSPLKRHSESITQGVASNTVFELIRSGGPYIMSTLALFLAYIQGWAWIWILLAGVGVFLALTIIVATIITLRAKHGAARSQSPPTPEQGAGNELEAQPVNETPNPVPCREKWLHDIADDQAQTLYRWVHLNDCSFSGGSELLRNDPFVEFYIPVDNRSVYDICFEELGGYISFTGRRLNGRVKWEQRPESITHGNVAPLVIHQSLSEDDALHILNSPQDSVFNFGRLEVRVGGHGSSRNRLPVQLIHTDHLFVSNEQLLAKYPKLQIDITNAQLRGLWSSGDDAWEELVSGITQNWIISYDNAPEILPLYEGYRSIIYNLSYSAPWEGQPLGSVINLQVIFKNPRGKAVSIQGFKLDTSPNVTRVTPAETGEIYDLPHSRLSGTKLDNLNVCPVEAEQWHPFDGWLQFLLRGVSTDHLEGATPTLIVLDETGERHPVECPPLHRK